MKKYKYLGMVSYRNGNKKHQFKSFIIYAQEGVRIIKSYHFTHYPTSLYLYSHFNPNLCYPLEPVAFPQANVRSLEM